MCKKAALILLKVSADISDKLTVITAISMSELLPFTVAVAEVPSLNSTVKPFALQ